MTVFISQPSTTLLVEKDDAQAMRDERTLKQFPDATVVRVKTKEEATDLLLNSPMSKYSQVSVEGQVWTPIQALEMWGAL